MSENVYWLHQNLTLITLLFIVLRAVVASLRQWRGESIGGHKLISISANTLLDTQILLGVILLFLGIKPPTTHLLLVAIAAVLAHYSYSVEKRQGSSIATVATAWGTLIPVAILLL